MLGERPLASMRAGGVARSAARQTEGEPSCGARRDYAHSTRRAPSRPPSACNAPRYTRCGHFTGPGRNPKKTQIADNSEFRNNALRAHEADQRGRYAYAASLRDGLGPAVAVAFPPAAGPKANDSGSVLSRDARLPRVMPKPRTRRA